ncbi:MAG: GAF domain-containing protein, partial [Opitutales bacterium]
MKSRRPESAVIDSLYRISSLLGNTDDPREAFELILGEIVRVLSATSGSISLINPDTGQLELETTMGLPPESPELKLNPGQGITGWVALHGKPLLVRDVREEARYFELKASVRSEMAAPMEDRGQVIGVVNVDSDTPGAFNENDLKVLSLMTAEAGKVARNLWLIQQLKTKTSQLESIITIGQRLVSKIELQEILDNITGEARKVMECKLCSLFLLTPDRTSLQLHSVSECGETFRKLSPLQVTDSSIGAVVQRKKQVEVLDISKTEDNYAFLEGIQAEGLVSFLAAPLFYEGNVIGVINAYTGHKHRFNNDEKRLFATMASLGAIAIQNARLYSRVFESEEKLRQNDRLNTLGLLSAEIAHEIRNPLTVLKLLFESLNIDFPEGDPRRRDAAII